MTRWVCPKCGKVCMKLTEEDKSIACLNENCDFFLPTVERAKE